jgi:hypothetical protein
MNRRDAHKFRYRPGQAPSLPSNNNSFPAPNNAFSQAAIKEELRPDNVPTSHFAFHIKSEPPRLPSVKPEVLSAAPPAARATATARIIQPARVLTLLQQSTASNPTLSLKQESSPALSSSTSSSESEEMSSDEEENDSPGPISPPKLQFRPRSQRNQPENSVATNSSTNLPLLPNGLNISMEFAEDLTAEEKGKLALKQLLLQQEFLAEAASKESNAAGALELNLFNSQFDDADFYGKFDENHNFHCSCGAGSDSTAQNHSKDCKHWQIRQYNRYQRYLYDKEQLERGEINLQLQNSAGIAAEFPEKAERTHDERYVRRYYKRGAFYNDLDDEESRKLMARDYSGPTEADKMTDKLLLPAIKQQHGFGLKNKYRKPTISQQDTSKFRQKL